MAPRRSKINKLDYNKLSANDVICPICRSILIKPVTLPCNHGFCFSCFDTTQNSSVVCPLCRVRVGSWLRSATKSKKLINETLWETIQTVFPTQVKNKLNKNRDKNKITESNGNKNGNSRRGNNKLCPELNSEELQLGIINKFNTTKEFNKLKVNPNSSPKNTSLLMQTNSKCHDELITENSNKTEKRSKSFVNNFATKEYTCRILCQNESSKDKIISKESQVLIQKKNKRIQEITQSEKLNDRSNSIESECLYFKPIDYRHNPPSEGLPPIKVPTRRPNVTSNIKILAPSGQNRININHQESAFVRLCSPVSSTEKETICKKENINLPVQENKSANTIKRKVEKAESKAKKKIKSNNSFEIQSFKSKESNVCDINTCKVSSNNSNVKNCTNMDQTEKDLTTQELKKRLMQEKADFELATKLQQTFNQSSKYSTRSTVLKRMTSKSQVKIGKMMTPYKVK